jgi:SAM-dependent methyltransferase
MNNLNEHMKLTNPDRWRYSNKLATRKNINTINRRDEWLSIIKKIIPDCEMKYLELGCAPGQYTAAIVEGTNWNVSGIDYSVDADIFVETISIVGKDAKLYKVDMFNERVQETFNIVCSFGLVEHFRGTLLDDVFKLHDSYLLENGYVVIEVPNFTGFHYIWHYIFDRPDMDNHNIDVMQPSALSWFENNGYEVLYNDYVGVLRLWGNSGFLKYRLVGKVVAGLAVGLSKVALLLDKLGFKLRGRTWSPALLFIARKKRNF